MKPGEVLLFTSELADLIEAGMTLGAALNSLANQGDPNSGICVVAADLRDRIMRGEAFSDAVEAHPDTFPAIYGNMVRAGEASGAMVEVLRRLGEHYERNQSMRSKIVSALTYPCIVLGMGVLAVIFAMLKIVPQFTELFSSMGKELPLPTRMLMGMSEGLIKYGVFIGIGLVFGVVALRKWCKGAGRARWDRFKLRVPLVKGLVASGAYASLAYTLQTLLANGVNVLQALRISEETCGNAVIEAELRKARERVTDGTTISGAARRPTGPGSRRRAIGTASVAHSSRTLPPRSEQAPDRGPFFVPSPPIGVDARGGVDGLTHHTGRPPNRVRKVPNGRGERPPPTPKGSPAHPYKGRATDPIRGASRAL